MSIDITPTGTMLRVLGDEPIPGLFHPEIFEVVTAIIPDSWNISSTKPGFITIGPAAWARAGFLEDFYDRKLEAVELFERERKKIVASDP